MQMICSFCSGCYCYCTILVCLLLYLHNNNAYKHIEDMDYIDSLLSTISTCEGLRVSPIMFVYRILPQEYSRKGYYIIRIGVYSTV